MVKVLNGQIYCINNNIITAFPSAHTSSRCGHSEVQYSTKHLHRMKLTIIIDTLIYGFHCD